MIQYKNVKQVDIAKGTAAIINLNIIHQGDSNANRIGAIVYENGEPLAMTGTCVGLCRRNDGNEIPLTGVVEGSQAYIVLDSNCYAVQGPVTVFVKWVLDSYETTLVCAFGTVVGSGGDALIQPVERIPDYAQLMAEIANMRAATADAEGAAAHSLRYDVAQELVESQRRQARENANAPAKVDVSLEFDSTHNYKIGEYAFSPNDGFLYRFTSDKAASAWNDSVVVKADLGNDLFKLKESIGLEFNPARAYAIGEYAFGPIDRYLYRFTADKAAGSWDSTKVVKVDLADQINSDISNLAAQTSSNTTDIGVIQRTIGSGLSPDNTVKSQLDGIKDDIGTVPAGSTVEDQITDLQDSIGTVPTGKTVEGQISELTTEVTNNRDYIGDLTAAVGTVPTGETVEGQIGDLKSALDANSKKLESKVDGAKTANLFDKSTAISGYYVGVDGLIEAEGWNASDYIEVEAGKTYSASVISNARYYDSGYTRTGNILASPFTVPSGVKYVRFSMQDANVDFFMCALGSTLPDSYVPYGCVLSMNSFTDEIIAELKDIMGVPDRSVDNNYLYHLREHLSNPFIRTQIKFVGDSITAGQGGTGYDASGTSGVLIGGTESSYQNVTSAICFSNMLYHFIADRYNQKIDVSVADDRIDKPYIGKSSALAKGTKTIGSFKIEYDQLTENNTIASRDFLSFSFYGTAFSIFNFKGNNKGKYEVYCDGTILETIDCYSATTEERYEQTFTGLTEGTHTVVLKTTATKNASSTLNQIVITGIAVTKHAVVVPWGISGTLSASAINTTGRYTTDDDFVILQYGTNDRHMYFSRDSTYENLISAAEIIKETYGAEPIFMCPPPVDESFEYDASVTRYYHMWDVHDAVCRVGEYYKIPVIDNYKAFMDYLDNHDNATLDDLLFDGLHPNDLGYAVIYDNIMDSLGLPRFPAYKAWPQSE